MFLAVCLVRCFPFFSYFFSFFFSFSVYFFYFFVFLRAAQNQQTKLLHASSELISVRFLADFTHSNVCTHTATYNTKHTHTLRVKGTFTHTHTLGKIARVYYVKYTTKITNCSQFSHWPRLVSFYLLLFPLVVVVVLVVVLGLFVL